MGFLGQREGPCFAARTDNTACRSRKGGQMLCLAASRAGSQFRGEACNQRQLEAEGEGGLQACGPGLVRIVEQRQVAAEEVVGGWIRLGGVEQTQNGVAGTGARRQG